MRTEAEIREKLIEHRAAYIIFSQLKCAGVTAQMERVAIAVLEWTLENPGEVHDGQAR